MYLSYMSIYVYGIHNGWADNGKLNIEVAYQLDRSTIFATQNYHTYKAGVELELLLTT